MLDNGAFSAWTADRGVDWPRYYDWCAPWLDYQTTWAVIPDVIDGGVEANDELIRQWPHGQRGAPVWHMHEPVDRLLDLSAKWTRICVGSSGDFRVVGTPRWHNRMVEAMNALCLDGPPPVWLHMLRGMSLAGSHYPFASLDSTDIGRNHNRPDKSAKAMALQWDAIQCAARWTARPIDQPLFGVAV